MNSHCHSHTHTREHFLASIDGFNASDQNVCLWYIGIDIDVVAIVADVRRHCSATNMPIYAIYVGFIVAP